ncbi:MAG: S1 family peptidase [Oscillospiraceae bacterium]|nr:S1 family peptidase [Oscillospiraceae bacterium]
MKKKKHLSALIAIFVIVALAVTGGVVSNTQVVAADSFPDVFVLSDLLEDEVFFTDVEQAFIEEFSEVFMRNQNNAISQLEEIESLLFSVEEVNGLFAAPSVRNFDTTDFWGGAYIDSEGNLVLRLVGVSQRAIASQENQVRSFATEQDIPIRLAEFSYAELNAKIDALNEILPSRRTPGQTPDHIMNVRSYGVCVMQNRVIVGLYPYSYENIAQFREMISDSPLLYFSDAGGPSEPAVCHTVRAGSGLRVNVTTTTHGGSVGYRAWRSGTRGFVTTAHTLGYFWQVNGVNQWRWGDSAIFNQSNNRIGSRVASRFAGVSGAAHAGNDFSFIAEHSLATVTNEIAANAGNHGTATAITISQGQAVGIVGSSGGAPILATGTITGTRSAEWMPFSVLNVSGAYEEVRIEVYTTSAFRAVNASRNLQRGDSGGIVFRTTGNQNILGILVAVNPFIGRTRFAPAYRINASLGLQTTPP